MIELGLQVSTTPGALAGFEMLAFVRVLCWVCPAFADSRAALGVWRVLGDAELLSEFGAALGFWRVSG